MGTWKYPLWFLLPQALHDTVAVSGLAAEALLLTSAALAALDARAAPLNHLQPDYERQTYERLPRKLARTLTRAQPRLVVLFNSLGQRRHEVVALRVTSQGVRVTDPRGNEVPIQLNPVWNDTGGYTELRCR